MTIGPAKIRVHIHCLVIKHELNGISVKRYLSHNPATVLDRNIVKLYSWENIEYKPHCTEIRPLVFINVYLTFAFIQYTFNVNVYIKLILPVRIPRHAITVASTYPSSIIIIMLHIVINVSA